MSCSLDKYLTSACVKSLTLVKVKSSPIIARQPSVPKRIVDNNHL